ncbi:hypothetical protein ACHAWU_010171 [Discostella pseudostelligera]|uniref:Uncharacterized protein n=1 Tax=Discostella pseudostelligera TaxID=259834 RepID=A0ABD3M0I9_9STRA
MTTDENEFHIGFMDSILGRAKKVLFPDAVDEGVGVGVGMESASPSSSSIANPNERRKPKSRARLAASTSMLANIASDVTESTGSGALKVRTGAVGAGKVNKLTKNSGKRGNTSKLDSLAMAFSINADSDAQSDRVSGIEMRQSKGVSYAKDCRQQHVVMKGDNVKKQARQPLKSLSANALSRESGPNSNFPVVSLKSKSASNCSDIDNPFTLSMATKNNGKVRRRGRCNNISFESNESSKERSKRYTGPSSLMMIPSSTQKVQRPTTSSSDAMRRQKPVSRRTTNNNKCVGNRLPPSSNRPSLENIISAENVNDTTLASALDGVSIGEGQTTCSTPHSIRHRNRLGSITSPPSFLHRLSKLSNPNFFQDHSPLPDSNPNLRKRFDGKKTPDNKSGVLMLTSPLASEATMSFSPFASEEEGNDATMNSSKVDEDQDFICRTSSATDIKSPIISGVVVSNEVPSISGQQGPDTNDIKAPLVGLEVAGTLETSSPHSIKSVGEMETNPAGSVIAPCCSNEDRHAELAEPITSTDCVLSNEPPPSNDQNAKSKPNGTTKRKPPTRPRVTKKNGDEVTSVEVRKSSRNSKPTDRLTVASWNNKKKPVRSKNTEPKDEEVITSKEKRMVRSGKGGSVNKGSTKKEKPKARSGKDGLVDKGSTEKEKPKARSGSKAKGDEDVEDGADWESYQSYIQSLLTRNCKPSQN